ncbi:hypothetical protein AtubIFM56815_005275 [Aspergillus tubingensis]|uniref:SNF2 N-terminal domain-containing protein n=1 Tax=Aspergillus tubingensis TaxID=5068 RepID=A0A9W6EJQ7_ASPTU|nr:hypothetical protein AtubIFM56815_005275 [Aspergillus tubingensis]
MAAHVDWHAALSEREIPSIQNPAFSRFCHARGTPATRLTDWLQAEREEAATGFFDSDVEPTVLPLGNKNGKSTDNVPDVSVHELVFRNGLSIRGGLLVDDYGLGKSVTTLAAIGKDRATNIIHCSFLILCPAALIHT